MMSDDPKMSRRDVLKTGALLGAGATLAACGSSSSSPATKTAVNSSKPKYGGQLRVALTGGASSDTLDAQVLVNFLDQARHIQLYNSLTELNLDAQPELSLLEEITPNATATEWVLRVKPDIVFHNGKPLTADDLIFSFQRIMDPKNPKPGAAQLSTLDWQHMRKIDTRTMSMPFTAPFSPLIQLLCDYYYFVVPVGYDINHPVGTGPFKFKSFTPGVQSVFTRNENYWQSGLPYVDEVVIDDFSDETSQINGLISGQVDAIGALSAASVATLTSAGFPVVISKTGSYTPITMRVDAAPFNNVNVRQAMKWLVDRQQMLDIVFKGYGLIGNDLYSLYDADYNTSIPQRTHDPDKAKSLLKAAGMSDLTVTLNTANIAAGTTEMATVFAQQAKAAGVTVNINLITATELFGPNYCKWVFAQDSWPAIGFLTNTGEGEVPGAPYNESHFDNPQFNALYSQALATIDPVKQKQIVEDMQLIWWNEGGYIIPYFTPSIDGHAKNLQGVVESKELYLSNFGFKNFWFS
jgi:peptide/nickel transport system substrate-binding protein